MAMGARSKGNLGGIEYDPGMRQASVTPHSVHQPISVVNNELVAH